MVYVVVGVWSVVIIDRLKGRFSWWMSGVLYENIVCSKVFSQGVMGARLWLLRECSSWFVIVSGKSSVMKCDIVMFV